MLDESVPGAVSGYVVGLLRDPVNVLPPALLQFFWRCLRDALLGQLTHLRTQDVSTRSEALQERGGLLFRQLEVV